jgi:hypothetical protein
MPMQPFAGSLFVKVPLKLERTTDANFIVDPSSLFQTWPRRIPAAAVSAKPAMNNRTSTNRRI